MASPCGQDFFNTGTLVSRAECPDRCPGRNSITFHDGTWKTIQAHSCHICQGSCVFPQAQGLRNGVYILTDGRQVLEMHVGLDILLWLFWGNTICHKGLHNAFSIPAGKKNHSHLNFRTQQNYQSGECLEILKSLHPVTFSQRVFGH